MALVHVRACTTSLARNLQPALQPGIMSCDVNLLAASATVKYLPGIISLQDIRDAIEDAGFGAELIGDQADASQEPFSAFSANTARDLPLDLNGITRTVMSIHGMTCASCSVSITQALRRNDKVISASVNVLSASGVIEHHASLQASAVKDIIEDAGFEAEVNHSAATSSAIIQTARLGKTSSNSTTRTVQIHVNGIYCLYVSFSLHANSLLIDSAADSVTRSSVENVSSSLMRNLKMLCSQLCHICLSQFTTTRAPLPTDHESHTTSET